MSTRMEMIDCSDQGVPFVSSLSIIYLANGKMLIMICVREEVRAFSINESHSAYIFHL